MSDSLLRRAALLWLRGFLLTAAAFAAALPFVLSPDPGTVFLVVRNPSEADSLSSLLAWLAPSAVFCGCAALAGTTVFCRSVLRAGCVLRGIGTGILFGLLSCGKLRLAHPRISIFLCLCGLFLWLAEAAFSAVFSDGLFEAFGKKDQVLFRSVMRKGLSVALTLSGAVFLTSALGWLAAGAQGL